MLRPMLKLRLQGISLEGISLALIAMMAVISVFTVGCERPSPVHPTAETDAWADQKNSIDPATGSPLGILATGKIEVVEATMATADSTAPGAPKFVKGVPAKMQLKLLYSVETNTFYLSVKDDLFRPEDTIRVFVGEGDDANIGEMTIKGEYYTLISFRIKDQELPAGGVKVRAKVLRGGNTVARAETDANRTPENTGITIVSVAAGKSADTVVLTFNEAIEGTADLYEEVVIMDAANNALTIWSYDARGSRLVVEMENDLTNGQHTVTYSGIAGLRSKDDGEAVPEFWRPFTVGNDSTAQTTPPPKEATAAQVIAPIWGMIPNGHHPHGDSFITAIDFFNRGISKGMRRILGTRAYPVLNPNAPNAGEKGTTYVYLVSASRDLGVQGPLTGRKISSAVKNHKIYGFLPAETAPQALLMEDVPVPYGVSYIVMTEELTMSGDNGRYLQVVAGGNVDKGEPRKNTYAIRVDTDDILASGDYDMVLVGLKNPPK